LATVAGWLLLFLIAADLFLRPWQDSSRCTHQTQQCPESPSAGPGRPV